jgi:hypothetical protein
MLHLDARTCGDGVLATRIAQKRSALTHMRAHSRGLVRETPSLWAANSV